MSLISYAIKRERTQREIALDKSQVAALAAESALELAEKRVDETRKARITASKRLDAINDAAKNLD